MSTSTEKAAAFQKRLVKHTVRLLSVLGKLPKTYQPNHVSRQLTRSATALAANYGEVRGAESRADFIHKLRIVLKELNETGVWLEVIMQSSWISQEVITPLIAENEELCRIIGASLRSAGGFRRDTHT